MRVWVEPVDYDEEVNGPRPIVQLDVESVSYLGDEEVRGHRAVSGQEPCESSFQSESLQVLNLCNQGFSTGRSLGPRLTMTKRDRKRKQRKAASFAH
jgi:hypothetical protein